MFAARRTFAALAALFAAAYAQTKCGSATSGSTNGTPIELKAFVMKPGQADFNVDVPNVCPAQSAIVGLTGVACDDDVPPLVVAYDTSHAHVHRQGNLETEGVIKTTVYCELLSKPRARYGLQPKHYPKYGVQSAYDSLRPHVSRMLGPSNLYDSPTVYNPYAMPKVYDLNSYVVPEAREHAASHEQGQGARNGYEAARSYADIGLVDAAQPYAPYAPIAPVVVPLVQN